MSLRDQLLKAGIASKKEARRADREKKEARKKAQATRRKKREVQAEEAARLEAEREAARAEALAERRRVEAEREAAERENRIRQLVRGNRLGARGPVIFHFVGRDGRRVHRLSVNDRIAWQLRCGEVAIAADPDTEDDYVVIPARAAEKLEAVAPELVVFRVTDTRGISAPEEAFLERQWEPTLDRRQLRAEIGADLDDE